MLFEGFEAGFVFFGVVEEGEGFAFDEPRDAEEGEQDDLEKHGGVAWEAGELGYHKEHFYARHAEAADAVDDVAGLLAGGHAVFACLGEQEGAVDGQHQEEEYGEGAVELVRDVHGQLEEAHERALVHPADAARKQHDAQAEEAAEGGDEPVPEVVAYVAQQHQTGGREYGHEGRRQIVGG